MGNAIETTKILINQRCNVTDTVLHCAVQANSVECIKYLLNIGINPNTLDANGNTPLHLAADKGYTECLKLLLARSIQTINQKSKFKQSTALHMAAENGYTECVQILLRAGSSHSVVNDKNQTALHLAAKAQCAESVEILLQLGAEVNALDIDKRTALHSAVCKAFLSFHVVEVLVKWGANVNIKDRYGFTPLYLAADNELSQCVDFLIIKGADISSRTVSGMSALSKIIKKTPTSINTIKKKLDQAISLNDQSSEDELIMDFRYLLQNPSQGEIITLHTLEECGQKSMLEHPLCRAFLHLKWQKIRRFYFVRLIFDAIFVLLLTFYVMTALAHDCYNISKNITDDKNITKNQALKESKPQNHNYLIVSINDCQVISHEVIELNWYILLVFTIIIIIRKLVGKTRFTSFKQFLKNITNIVEWFVVASVFLTTFLYGNRTHEWQNPIGAFAVLFGWSNLMVVIGQLPIFGTYIAMFTKVQKEFAKLLLAYSCLLIGFTISFCTLFPDSHDFSNPLISFIKVLIMMTGELDINVLLGPDSNRNPASFDVSAYITFILFIVFVTVVLMNLLVGIAVHDIEGLLKTADLSKLVRQTRLIHSQEQALFQGYLPRRVISYFNWSARVTPSAYRVVLYVKPAEKRLPKNIMNDALDLAKQKRLNTVDYKQAVLENKMGNKALVEEIKQLKEIVQHQQHLLLQLINKSS